MKPPFPALPLSDALLFADPVLGVLRDLGNHSDRWKEALVLATPFWAPRVGKLNRPVDLDECGVPPLNVTSLSFDPDRELCIASLKASALSDATKAVLGTCRRIRVLPSCDAQSLTGLRDLMPELKAIQFGTASQLSSFSYRRTTPASLEEVGVSSCRDVMLIGLNFDKLEKNSLRQYHIAGCPTHLNVGPLTTFPNLQVVTFRGCHWLTDISPLSSVTTLEELSFDCCRDLEDISALGSLPRLHTVKLLHCSNRITYSPLRSVKTLTSLSVTQTKQSAARLGKVFGNRRASLAAEDGVLHITFRQGRSAEGETLTAALANLTGNENRGLDGLRAMLMGSHDNAVDSSSASHADPMAKKDANDPWKYNKDTPPFEVPTKLLGAYMEFLRSDSAEENVQGARMIGKYAYLSLDTPIHLLLKPGANVNMTKRVVEAGCVPLLAAHLRRDELPELQLEAVTALHSIMCDLYGEPHSNMVALNVTVLSNIVRLLRSQNEACRAKAADTITNVNSISTEVHNRLFRCGVVQNLVAMVPEGADFSRSSTRLALRALSFLHRREPLPNNGVQLALPVFVRMLNQKNDVELVSLALLALVGLCENEESEGHIGAIVDSGCLPRVVHLLAEESRVAEYALSVVDNIFDSHEEEHIDAVAGLEVLPNLRQLLAHSEPHVKKQVCSALCRIFPEYNTAAFLRADLIPGIIDALSSTDVEVKKEAMKVIDQVSDTREVIDQLVSCDVISSLASLLSNNNNETLCSETLYCLETLLDRSSSDRVPLLLSWSPYYNELVESGCVDRVEHLATHENSDDRKQSKFHRK